MVYFFSTFLVNHGEEMASPAGMTPHPKPPRVYVSHLRAFTVFNMNTFHRSTPISVMFYYLYLEIPTIFCDA